MDVALDAEMEEGAFSSMLVTALPESLPLVRVRAVEERHPKLMARLKTATYEATFPANAASISMIEAIPAFLDRNAVLAIRKTKRGEHPCDIRPMLHSLEAERQEGDAVLFRFRTSQTELQTLKPSLLLSTLAREAACEMPDGMRLHRSCLYGEREDGTPVPLMEME